MDSTQMTITQRYKYLLVMIDNLTGWIEGFPFWTKKGKEMVLKKKKKSVSCNHSQIWPAQAITK